MSNIIVAITLAVLTLIRLTTLRGRNARSALSASALATGGFILYVEQVYNRVDPLLGGGNRTALLMVLMVTAAFWQLHKSTMSATLAADPPALGRKLRQGLIVWIIASIEAITGFVLSDLPVTSQSLIRTYGTQPGVMAFFLALSCFIAYVAVDVSIASFRNLSRMSPLFRAGFLMIGMGCSGALGLLAWRNISQFKDPAFFHQPHIIELYGILQVLVVLLVAVGLSLSPLLVVARLVKADVTSRWYLLRIAPVWNLVVAGQDDMILDPERFSRLDCLRPDPLSRLHRRVTELRDCQRAGDERGVSNTAVISAEKLLLIT